MVRRFAFFSLTVVWILLGLILSGCQKEEKGYELLKFSGEKVKTAEKTPETEEAEGSEAEQAEETGSGQDESETEATNQPTTTQREETAPVVTIPTPTKTDASTSDLETEAQTEQPSESSSESVPETTAETLPVETTLPEEPVGTVAPAPEIRVMLAAEPPKTSSWNNNILVNSIRTETTENANGTFKVKVYMNITNVGHSVQVVSAGARLSGRDADDGFAAYLDPGASGEVGATFNNVPSGTYVLTY